MRGPAGDVDQPRFPVEPGGDQRLPWIGVVGGERTPGGEERRGPRGERPGRAAQDDGDADEDTDLQNDDANCGACGAVCALFQAEAHCETGTCTFDPATDCAAGFLDVDGDLTNGCEYACTASNGGVERCDLIDNDCDGLTDEGFCRIAGTCFTDGQLNPANNCQVCAAAAGVSGPSTWGNVAAGVVCRAAAGVCAVSRLPLSSASQFDSRRRISSPAGKIFTRNCRNASWMRSRPCASTDRDRALQLNFRP